MLPLLLLLMVKVLNFGGFFAAWIDVAKVARAGVDYFGVLFWEGPHGERSDALPRGTQWRPDRNHLYCQYQGHHAGLPNSGQSLALSRHFLQRHGKLRRHCRWAVEQGRQYRDHKNLLPYGHLNVRQVAMIN